MKEYRFAIDLSEDEILRYYAGDSVTIRVSATNGRHVRFPASALRPFVTPEGVHGAFFLRTDDDNKLIELKRISPLPG